MPGVKNTVLFSLLALTLCAAVWVSDVFENSADDKSNQLMPEKRQKNLITATTVTNTNPVTSIEKKSQDSNRGVLQLDKLRRNPMNVEANNPFSAKSWYSAPPPLPVASLPPAAPTAPPLPFIYAGKLQEDAEHTIFYLTHGEQFFAVQKGETFDNVYRLERVENDKLVISYLPLSIKQFLPITPEF